MTEYYYRVEDNTVVTWDPDTERITSRRVELIQSRFKVLRHTPCGVWIYDHINSRERFINANWRKRYALPTQAEALNSFIARKTRQKRILETKLRLVEQALRHARNENVNSFEGEF